MSEDMFDVDYENVTLDDELMEEFSEELETAVNRVFERHTSEDPRLELLVTLASFASQVGTDLGFDKKEFMELIQDVFSDFEEPEEVDQKTVN